MSPRSIVIVALITSATSACVDAGRSAPWPELGEDLSFLVVGDTADFDVVGRFSGAPGPVVHSDPEGRTTYLLSVSTEGLATRSTIPDALDAAGLRIIGRDAPACAEGRLLEDGHVISFDLTPRAEVFRLQPSGFTEIPLTSDPWNRTELALPTEPTGCAAPITLTAFSAGPVVEPDQTIRGAFFVDSDRVVAVSSTTIRYIERGEALSTVSNRSVLSCVVNGTTHDCPTIVAARAYLRPGEFVALTRRGRVAYLSHFRASASRGIEIVATSSLAIESSVDEFAFDEHGRIVVSYAVHPDDDFSPIEAVLTTDAPGQALLERPTPGVSFREIQFTGPGNEFAFAGAAYGDRVALANFFDGPTEVLDITPDRGNHGGASSVGVVEQPNGNMVWISLDAFVEHPVLRRAPRRDGEWNEVKLRVPASARACADTTDSCGHSSGRRIRQMANLTPGRAMMMPHLCGQTFVVDPASSCELQLATTADLRVPSAIDWRDGQVLVATESGEIYEAPLR